LQLTVERYLSTLTIHPTPFTLHPIPYTLYPTPYTLHPTPYTLHPTFYALHPTPYTQHPAPHTLHPTPCTLHPTPTPWSRSVSGCQRGEASPLVNYKVSLIRERDRECDRDSEGGCGPESEGGSETERAREGGIETERAGSEMPRFKSGHRQLQGLALTASEQRGNNVKGFENFYLVHCVLLFRSACTPSKTLCHPLPSEEGTTKRL